MAKRLAGGSDSEKMSRRPFSISSTVQTLRATESNRNDREKRRNSEARTSFKTTCGGVYYAQTGRRFPSAVSRNRDGVQREQRAADVWRGVDGAAGMRAGGAAGMRRRMRSWEEKR